MIFLASVINKDEMNYRYGTNARDPYLISFEFLVERFDNFLKGQNDYGMIQIEFGNKDLTNNLKNAHESFLSNGTDFQKIVRIIESCNFVYGPKNNFTQIADLFINSVYRCVEYGNRENYEKYKPYVRCSSNGTRIGYGIKYFPEVELGKIKI